MLNKPEEDAKSGLETEDNYDLNRIATAEGAEEKNFEGSEVLEEEKGLETSEALVEEKGQEASEAVYDDESNDDTLEIIEEHKKGKSKSFLYDLIFYAVLIFVCIYILPNFVIQRTIVDGSSMENTLFNGEHLYVEKLSYRFDALDRFDIIVFYPYGRENEEYYVKRIIGLPGETVQIKDGDIYINNEILEENYGKDPIIDAGRAAEPITLAKDEYFVLGDNRTISKDSRSEEVGNVKKENIGGRAILRIKPLNKFGPID